jgi:4-carboxymuconolactone decarboxylase
MKTAAKMTLAVLSAGAGGWLACMAFNAPAMSKEPRFPQLTMEQLNSEQRPVAERVMGFSIVGLGGPYNGLLRSPAAATALLDLLDYLRFHTSVPKRLNEFAIVIQARLWRNQLVWFGHAPVALKAGVSEQTIAELKLNKRPTTMQPDEAAVYDFCTELYTHHAVSDESYARLHRFFNDRQIVDLTILSGTYGTIVSFLAMSEQGMPPGEEPPFKPGDP